MDRRTFLTATSAALLAPRARSTMLARAVRPVPSPSQLQWQRDELAMFLHFGVNTFTDREWGDGKEDPAIFNPSALDARQWARAAKLAGFRAMILTAKHHDGFCLWPTATTRHSVASSPFRGGNGDVVREFVDACRAEGLRPGLYLSPWDRNHPTYGDSPRYNDVYAAQLTELLTRYGELAEVWFDGANGEGPNGKRQEYDWPRVFGLVRRLQPNAVMFSDAGPDVRWCGNERGEAGDPNWSTVNPASVRFPGDGAPGVEFALQHGDPNGSVWRPAEADVSIRPGWFYHPKDDERVRTPENLFDLYTKSVGRNSKLLLNVPPTPAGLLHSVDVDRLQRFRVELDRRTRGATVLAGATRNPADRRAILYEFEYRGGGSIGMTRLAEDISKGQVVAGYTLEGRERAGSPWIRLARGATIGYAKIDRFPALALRSFRLLIHEALDSPKLTLTVFPVKD